MKHDLGIVAAYKWSQRNSFAAWITFERLRIGREDQRKVIVLSKAPGAVCQWSVERSSVVMCWLLMGAMRETGSAPIRRWRGHCDVELDTVPPSRR
jgi:hypothetical protein